MAENEDVKITFEVTEDVATISFTVPVDRLDQFADFTFTPAANRAIGDKLEAEIERLGG